MNENAFINVTRGSGREFVTTAVIVRELAAKYKKVYCAIFNYEFGEALSKELNNVIPIKENEIGSFWNTHWAELHNNVDVFNEEPYNLGRFGMRRLHFIDAYRFVTGLTGYIEPTAWEDGFRETDLPSLEVPMDIHNAALDFSKQHKKFVMVQFHGGQNPVGFNPQTPYNYDEVGLKRHYPLQQAEELCAKLKADGYEVLHYTLPNEPHLKNAIYMQNVMPQLFYHELSKYAEGIITIDSSLMHLGIKHCKKMVVIWAQTSPISFGYYKAINLRKVKDDDIGGPSMQGVPLNPVVEYPSVDEIYNAFVKGNKD